MNRKQIAKFAHDYIQYYHGLHKGNRPIVVGLSAPQGCGKTTLTRALREQFAAEGIKSAVISLDDVYLPRAEQVKLAESSGNPLLEFRGNGIIVLYYSY
jgi:pantothenate kinase-related protein Tda10